MTTEIEQNYPVSGWISGFPLSPSHWTTEVEESAETVNFSTLNAIGEIAPQGSLPAWSLTLPLPEDVNAQQVHLFANGYRIETNSGNIDVIVLAPGALLGHLPQGVTPDLFSSAHETSESGPGQGIFTENCAVYLETKAHEGGQHFALIHEQTAEVAATLAEMLLDYDAAELIDNEIQRRQMYYGIARDAATEKRPLSSGIILAPECLVASLRGANTNYPNFWVAAPKTEDMDLNDLYPNILGWINLDPEIAKGLFHSALSTQTTEGLVPASPHAPEDFAWPLLIRSAMAIYKKTEDQVWLGEQIPALETYLLACINQVDPDFNGCPQWPDDAVCITPEVWDENLDAVDLAGLLRAECRTLSSLARTLDYASAGVASLEEYAEKLQARFSSWFWNEEQKAYMDRYRDGDFVSRASAGALWPLLSATDEMQGEDHIRSLLRRKKLLQETGVLSWEAWDQDEVKPDHFPIVQILALEALSQTDAREDHQLITQNNLSYFDQAFNQGRPFFRIMKTEEEKPKLHYFDPTTAAMIMQCWNEQSDAVQTYEQYPRIVRWMDARRLTLTFITAAFIAASVLFIGNYYARKNSFTPGLVSTYSGLARHMKNMGDNDQAIELFSHILSRTTQKPLIVDNEIQLANVYYKTKEYEKARVLYQKAVDSDVMESPQKAAPLWNLGQTTYKMGQYAEAKALFNNFISEYETLYPSLSERAELTLMLISEEIERQRYK